MSPLLFVSSSSTRLYPSTLSTPCTCLLLRPLSTSTPLLARVNRRSSKPPGPSKAEIKSSFDEHFYSKYNPSPRQHDADAVVRPPKKQAGVVDRLRRTDQDTGAVRDGAKPDPNRFKETNAGRLLNSIDQWPPPSSWKGKGPYANLSPSSSKRTNPYLAPARPVTTPLEPTRSTGWRTETAYSDQFPKKKYFAGGSVGGPPPPWSRAARELSGEFDGEEGGEKKKVRSPTGRVAMRSKRATTSEDYASAKDLGIHLRRAVLDDKVFDLEEARERVLEAPGTIGLAVGVWNVLISIAFKQERGKRAFELYNEMKKRGIRPNGRTYASLLGGLPAPSPTGPVPKPKIDIATALYANSQTYFRLHAHPAEHSNFPLNNYMKWLAAARQHTLIRDTFNALPPTGPLSADTVTWTLVFGSLNGQTDMRTALKQARELWQRLVGVVRSQSQAGGEMRVIPDGYLLAQVIRIFTKGDREDQLVALDLARTYFHIPSSVDCLPPPVHHPKITIPPIPAANKAKLEGTTLNMLNYLFVQLDLPKAIVQLYSHLSVSPQSSLSDPSSSPLSSRLNTGHLNKALEACADMGDSKKALSLLLSHKPIPRNAPPQGNQPPILLNHTSYSAALQACARVGDWLSAMTVFRKAAGLGKGIENPPSPKSQPRAPKSWPGRIPIDASFCTLFLQTALAASHASTVPPASSPSSSSSDSASTPSNAASESAIDATIIHQSIRTLLSLSSIASLSVLDSHWGDNIHGRPALEDLHNNPSSSGPDLSHLRTTPTKATETRQAAKRAFAATWEAVLRLGLRQSSGAGGGRDARGSTREVEEWTYCLREVQDRVAGEEVLQGGEVEFAQLAAMPALKPESDARSGKTKKGKKEEVREEVKEDGDRRESVVEESDAVTEDEPLAEREEQQQEQPAIEEIVSVNASLTDETPVAVDASENEKKELEAPIGPIP